MPRSNASPAVCSYCQRPTIDRMERLDQRGRLAYAFLETPATASPAATPAYSSYPLTGAVGANTGRSMVIRGASVNRRNGGIKMKRAFTLGRDSSGGSDSDLEVRFTHQCEAKSPVSGDPGPRILVCLIAVSSRYAPVQHPEQVTNTPCGLLQLRSRVI
jgi:hypothetical protein